MVVNTPQLLILFQKPQQNRKNGDMGGDTVWGRGTNGLDTSETKVFVTFIPKNRPIVKIFVMHFWGQICILSLRKKHHLTFVMGYLLF